MAFLCASTIVQNLNTKSYCYNDNLLGFKLRKNPLRLCTATSKETTSKADINHTNKHKLRSRPVITAGASWTRRNPLEANLIISILKAASSPAGKRLSYVTSLSMFSLKKFISQSILQRNKKYLIELRNPGNSNTTPLKALKFQTQHVFFTN